MTDRSGSRPGGWWRRLEDGALVAALVALVGLAVYQITARNLFDTGWVWGDQVVRVLVLWSGFLGAVITSREDRHLRIDLLTRVLGPRGRRIQGFLVHLFSAAVCAVIAWHSTRFVLDERDFAAPGIAAVPGWVLATVIPAAFTLMCLRHILVAFRGGSGHGP